FPSNKLADPIAAACLCKGVRRAKCDCPRCKCQHKNGSLVRRRHDRTSTPRCRLACRIGRINEKTLISDGITCSRTALIAMEPSKNSGWREAKGSCHVLGHQK